jgi:hypothetical protein
LTLGEAPFPNGASWGSRGTIAFTPTGGASALLKVPDIGGTQLPLLHLAKGEVAERWPDFLPGGKAVLFGSSSNAISFSNAQVDEALRI